MLLERTAHKQLGHEARLLSLAYHSVLKRLTGVLLAYPHLPQPEDPPVLRVSRDDLAATVGASRETISRTLSELHAIRLIDVKGVTITLLDPEKLRRIRG